MKHSVTALLQQEASDLGYKLAGLGKVLTHFSPDHLLDSEDFEDLQGVGAILTGLSRQALRIGSLIDRLEYVDPKSQVEITRNEMDSLGKIESTVEELIKKEREVTTRGD